MEAVDVLRLDEHCLLGRQTFQHPVSLSVASPYGFIEEEEELVL
jgi:hypothetical protein